MPFLRTCLVASALFAAAAEPAETDYREQLRKTREKLGKGATHHQIKAVKLSGPGGLALQTLAVDGKGRVLALVAPPRAYGKPVTGAAAEVHVLDPDGKPVGVWKVAFHANAINAGPDGTVYVAGDGKVLRFSKDGTPAGEPVALPHIAELLKDKAALRARAEKQVEDDKKSRAENVKRFKEQLAKLEAKTDEELTKTEKARKKQYAALIGQMADDAKGAMTVQAYLDMMTGRLRVINGVAASATDVFLACGESEGYGYAVWRLDRDLKNPTRVLTGLGGCCGQMDVQCCGGDLLVAENTKHQFARYTREGKPLGRYGRRGQPDAGPAGFGGCCNPMNLRACPGGVLTAESEGVVKKFSDKGEFVGVVGTVDISGGCKNVAVGTSPDGGRVYFCDQPGSRVLILAAK